MDNNWTIHQTKKLFDLVYEVAMQEQGLRIAFQKMSDSCGKSVNSVRNYYYSQLKMFELVPKLASDLGIKIIKNQRKEFDFFSHGEIEELIETILVEKARGKSVRAIIADMAKGDAKKALRLQNKFRSMISHHKEKIIALMNELGGRGIVYYNPYSKQIVDGAASDNLQKLNEYIGKLDSNEVGSFLNMIRKLM